MFNNKIKVVVIAIFVLSVNLFCSKTILTLFVLVCYLSLETTTNSSLSSTGSIDDNASCKSFSLALYIKFVKSQSKTMPSTDFKSLFET